MPPRSNSGARSRSGAPRELGATRPRDPRVADWPLSATPSAPPRRRARPMLRRRRPSHRPATPAGPSRKRDLEDLLGGRVLAWLGGVAILAGLAFLLTIAISRGWLGEGARTVARRRPVRRPARHGRLAARAQATAPRPRSPRPPSASPGCSARS